MCARGATVARKPRSPRVPGGSLRSTRRQPQFKSKPYEACKTRVRTARLGVAPWEPPRELGPRYPRARSPCAAAGTVVRSGAGMTAADWRGEQSAQQFTTTSLESLFWEENETMGEASCRASWVANAAPVAKSAPSRFTVSRHDANARVRCARSPRNLAQRVVCQRAVGTARSTRWPIHANNDGRRTCSRGTRTGQNGDHTWASVARAPAGTPSSPVDMPGGQGWETRQAERWNDVVRSVLFQRQPRKPTVISDLCRSNCTNGATNYYAVRAIVL